MVKFQLMSIIPVLLCAANLTLPVGEVKTMPVFKERMYPARVVAIQRVDVTPQVSGEILEVAHTCPTFATIRIKGHHILSHLPLSHVSHIRCRD